METRQVEYKEAFRAGHTNVTSRLGRRLRNIKFPALGGVPPATQLRDGAAVLAQTTRMSLIERMKQLFARKRGNEASNETDLHRISNASPSATNHGNRVQTINRTKNETIERMKQLFARKRGNEASNETDLHRTSNASSSAMNHSNRVRTINRTKNETIEISFLQPNKCPTSCSGLLSCSSSTCGEIRESGCLKFTYKWNSAVEACWRDLLQQCQPKANTCVRKCEADKLEFHKVQLEALKSTIESLRVEENKARIRWGNYGLITSGNGKCLRQQKMHGKVLSCNVRSGRQQWRFDPGTKLIESFHKKCLMASQRPQKRVKLVRCRAQIKGQQWLYDNKPNSSDQLRANVCMHPTKTVAKFLRNIAMLTARINSGTLLASKVSRHACQYE